jgi:hypothetical protein
MGAGSFPKSIETGPSHHKVGHDEGRRRPRRLVLPYLQAGARPLPEAVCPRYASLPPTFRLAATVAVRTAT